MDWVELAYTLKNKFDYIEFAIACRDNNITQEFRPRDYVEIMKHIDEFVQQGRLPLEAKELSAIKSRENVAMPIMVQTPCSNCGGGREVR